MIGAFRRIVKQEQLLEEFEEFNAQGGRDVLATIELSGKTGELPGFNGDAASVSGHDVRIFSQESSKSTIRTRSGLESGLCVWILVTSRIPLEYPDTALPSSHVGWAYSPTVLPRNVESHGGRMHNP
jgi:hypothetical protein